MRKASSIILGIVLGSMATGIGCGFFLHKANASRRELVESVETTIARAEQQRQNDQRAVEEQQRHAIALAETLAQTQQRLTEWEEEARIMERATNLASPSASEMRQWMETVSVELGIAFKHPSRMNVEMNIGRVLDMAIRNDTNDHERSLSIRPFDARTEEEWKYGLTSSTEVAYAGKGYALVGIRGTLPGSSDAIQILRLRQYGTTTHVLWTRESGEVSLPMLLKIFATFTLNS